MKITRRQLRKIIKEAIDSKIIQPNMSMRSAPHAYQFGAIPPEALIPNKEFQSKISTLRAGLEGGGNTADSLVGGLGYDTDPLFGTGVEGETYQDIKQAHEDFMGVDGLPAFYEDMITGDSAYLEIMYPFANIAMDSPELENTRLWKIMDDPYRRIYGDIYTGETYKNDDGSFKEGYSDPFRFYKDIKEYVEDPNYADERKMLSQYQEFGWQHGFDSFEDFLMEKAERIKEHAQYELDSDFGSY